MVQNDISIGDGSYVSSNERVRVEINDKPVSEFEKYQNPSDPVERMMCRMFPGYNKDVPVHATDKEEGQTVKKRASERKSKKEKRPAGKSKKGR